MTSEVGKLIKLSMSKTGNCKMTLARYCNAMMEQSSRQDNLIAYQFYRHMAELIADDLMGNIIAHILLHAENIKEVYEDSIDQQSTNKIPVVD